MRRVNLLIAFCLLVLVAGSAVVSAEVLKVATDATFAPFEFLDEKTKKPAGFDVDLVEAIGEIIGAEVQVINVAWDGLIPGLQLGNYDMIAAAMAITDERKLAVDFSRPYFVTGQVIVVKAGNTSIKTPEDLKGKRVGVQIGTTGDYAAEAIGGVDVKRYENAPAAFMALKVGQVHAVVVDELVAIQELNANPGQTVIAGRPFATEEYGIAVRKGNKALLDRINAALEQIQADGTYEKLYEKWIASLN